MRLSISIDRNTDTDIVFAFSDASGAPVDLSGYALKMQVRPRPMSETLFDELSTENGRLVLEEAGRVRGTISAADSMKYPACSSSFDILAISPEGRQTRITEGIIDASAEVTR